MLIDGDYEYESMRRGVVVNGKQSQRYVFVRRRIGTSRWIWIQGTDSYETMCGARFYFEKYKMEHGIKEVGQ